MQIRSTNGTNGNGSTLTHGYLGHQRPYREQVALAAKQPPLITIKGRRLVLRGRTKTQRALLLRDIASGKIRVVDLTVRQIAAIVEVGSTYAYAAVHLEEGDCDAVRRGERPLIQPKLPAPPLSPRERIDQIVAEIGFDETLSLLATSEKAAA